MAQGSFSAQVSGWCAKSKRNARVVRNESTRRVIAVMQEPGPSKATVAKAIAKGAGLGKALKHGGRGVSKRAFGPIPNPGGTGNLPVDTGFLRASLVVGKGTLSVPTSAPATEGGSYRWDQSQVSLVLNGAALSDPIEARYTAVYARVAEYGDGKRQPRRFVALAAQQWQRIVSDVCAEVTARAGG